MKTFLLYILLFTISITSYCQFRYEVEVNFLGTEQIIFYSSKNLKFKKNIIDTLLINNSTFVNIKKDYHEEHLLKGKNISCIINSSVNLCSYEHDQWSLSGTTIPDCYQNKYPNVILQFDSLNYFLRTDDTLRFKILSYLDSKVADYGISKFNIQKEIDNVSTITMFKSIDLTKKHKHQNTLHELKDTTLNIYSHFSTTPKKLTKKNCNNFINIMSNEWNRISTYNLSCFSPNYLFILSDRNNNFIGKLELMSYEGSCGEVYRFTTYKNGKVHKSDFGSLYDSNALKEIIK